MTEPRYIVRESYGVPIRFTYGEGRQSSTEIMVMDSWDCYAVVYRTMGGGITPARSRKRARKLCDQWNAEHDAFMLEDAQAREGTAS